MNRNSTNVSTAANSKQPHTNQGHKIKVSHYKHSNKTPAMRTSQSPSPISPLHSHRFQKSLPRVPTNRKDAGFIRVQTRNSHLEAKRTVRKKRIVKNPWLGIVDFQLISSLSADCFISLHLSIYLLS